MCPPVAETLVGRGAWGGLRTGRSRRRWAGALPRAVGSPAEAEAGRAQSRWREAGSAAGAQEPPGGAGAGVRDPGEVAAPAEAEAGAPPSQRLAAFPARISLLAAQSRVPPGPSGPPGWARIWTWGAAPGEGAPVPPPLPPAALDSGDLPPMGRSDWTCRQEATTRGPLLSCSFWGAIWRGAPATSDLEDPVEGGLRRGRYGAQCDSGVFPQTAEPETRCGGAGEEKHLET